MLRSSRLLLSLASLGVILLSGCGSSRSSVNERAARDTSIVAVIGGEALTLPDFENRYARSVGNRRTAASDSAAAYQEFLDRYVAFRLKVLEAQSLGLSDDPQIEAEMAAYRNNLARPYLLEQEVLEPIMRSVYAHLQEVVDASHILIRLPENASPQDTLEAYRRIQAVADSIRAGADFGMMAVRHSEDPSASNAGGPGYQGHLGYFTAGRMVEEFEQVAYATPVGQVSAPFRTQFGYHILKVLDRQPARPDLRLAHIMIVPNGPADTTAAAQEAAEVRRRLAAGEDFAALARAHSDHTATAERGGELGYLNYYMAGQVPDAFRRAAFDLKNVGDFSDVVRTPFGYHIIKLLDRRSVDSYEAIYDELKTHASRLSSAKAAERRLALQIRQRAGTSVDSAAVRSAFAGIPVDSVLVRLFRDGVTDAISGRKMAAIGDSSYTFASLVRMVQSGRLQPAWSGNEPVFAVIEQFLNEKALDYEAAQLETRDEEFRRLMVEFNEGLVLFKLMEDSVWTAAAQDSVALVRQFEANTARYRFPDRIRIIAFHSASDSLLQAVTARLDAGVPLAQVVADVAADSTHRVRVDTSLVAGATNSVLDRALQLADGSHTELLPLQRERVVLVRAGMDPARQKTFEEARAEVLSDYQQMLEDRLVARLREKYRAQVFPERLVHAFGTEKGTGAASETTATK